MTGLIARPIVDVSRWQATARLNWTEAKAAGIVGVIAKATQGVGGRDPAFRQHLRNAYDAGIRLLGGYHFLDAGDPAKQASHLVEIMDEDFSDDLTGRLLALDLEGNPMGASESVAGAAEVAAAIFGQIGRWPVLYMGVYGPDGRGTGLPNATLAKCDLWLPAYGRVPRVPKGFGAPGSAPPAHGGVLRLWQDTDGTANAGMPVPGLGRVDQSRAFFDTLEELSAWWGT
jgi:GH25 family lysozyme M1 (1,4-beta-N-acetylmuramidase)